MYPIYMIFNRCSPYKINNISNDIIHQYIDIINQLTTHRQSIYICNTCLVHFHIEKALNKHRDDDNKIATRLPSADNNIFVYADFECVLDNKLFKRSFIEK